MVSELLNICLDVKGGKEYCRGFVGRVLLWCSWWLLGCYLVKMFGMAALVIISDSLGVLICCHKHTYSIILHQTIYNRMVLVLFMLICCHCYCDI